MVKTEVATGLPIPVPSGSSTAAKATEPKPARSFTPKPTVKPEDLRAVFDDTCARYPKTLARLAE